MLLQAHQVEPCYCRQFKVVPWLFLSLVLLMLSLRCCHCHLRTHGVATLDLVRELQLLLHQVITNMMTETVRGLKKETGGKVIEAPGGTEAGAETEGRNLNVTDHVKDQDHAIVIDDGAGAVGEIEMITETETDKGGGRETGVLFIKIEESHLVKVKTTGERALAMTQL